MSIAAASEAMETNGLDLSLIAPRNGDKYSQNLYLYLTGKETRHITARYARVYADGSSAKWLGYIDNEGVFIGARLTVVLCYGRKATTGCWGRKLGRLQEVIGFWGHYVKDGRCAIDPEHEMHFVDDATRWRGGIDERECLWCGKVRQRRERYTRTTEYERWVTT